MTDYFASDMIWW